MAKDKKDKKDQKDTVEHPDYPVAHVIDKVFGWRSMCGQEIAGEELPDRTLAYTCSACQVAVTEAYNVTAEALTDALRRLQEIQKTSSGFMMGESENLSFGGLLEKFIGRP